jgi:hypothetical protein
MTQPRKSNEMPGKDKPIGDSKAGGETYANASPGAPFRQVTSRKAMSNVRLSKVIPITRPIAAGRTVNRPARRPVANTASVLNESRIRPDIR